LHTVGFRSAVAVSILAVPMIGYATPAQAATLTDVALQCATSPSGWTPRLSPSSVTGATSGDTIRVMLSGVTSATASFSGVTGSGTLTSAAAEVYLVTSSSPAYMTFTVLTSAGNNCDGKSVTLPINGGSPGGGEDSSPAQTLELELNSADGTQCTSSVSGMQGTWVNLPAANECTPPASKAGATLLGWATTPTFPVAVAQRQVDNGWGTYESFNAEGQLVAVFIPAGRATYLSGDNNLYAIWNK
jgi:hypothetical protein